MYHPGIVLEILSPNDKNVFAVDKTIQATLKMWDENLITVLVDSKIGQKIKKNDTVLVDYRPIPNTSAPKLTVIKILKGNLAKTIWNTYKNHFKKFRVKRVEMGKSGRIVQTPQEYVG
jgi:hypothetical protein